MKVVFVGDRPSARNTSQDVAFIGTPSFVNLCGWISEMEVSNFTMVNSYYHKILNILNYRIRVQGIDS